MYVCLLANPLSKLNHHAHQTEIEANILAEESTYNRLMQEHYPIKEAA